MILRGKNCYYSELCLLLRHGFNCLFIYVFFALVPMIISLMTQRAIVCLLV